MHFCWFKKVELFIVKTLMAQVAEKTAEKKSI